jgi:hypothetical protein
MEKEYNGFYRGKMGKKARKGKNEWTHPFLIDILRSKD